MTMLLGLLAGTGTTLLPSGGAVAAPAAWPGHATLGKRPVFRPVKRADRARRHDWRPRIGAEAPFIAGERRPPQPTRTLSAASSRTASWTAAPGTSVPTRLRRGHEVFRPDPRAVAADPSPWPESGGGRIDAAALPAFRPVTGWRPPGDTRFVNPAWRADPAAARLSAAGDVTDRYGRVGQAFVWQPW